MTDSFRSRRLSKKTFYLIGMIIFLSTLGLPAILQANDRTERTPDESISEIGKELDNNPPIFNVLLSFNPEDPSAPHIIRTTRARPMAEYDFGPACDADRDGWPDGWLRERGPAFPRHPRVALIPSEQNRAAPAEQRQLLGASAVGSDSPAKEAAFRGSKLGDNQGLIIEPDGGAVSLLWPAGKLGPGDYLLEISGQTGQFIGSLVVEIGLFDSPSRKFIPLVEQHTEFPSNQKSSGGQGENQAEQSEPSNLPWSKEGPLDPGPRTTSQPEKAVPGFGAFKQWLLLPDGSEGPPQNRVTGFRPDSSGKQREVVIRIRVFPLSRNHREGEIRLARIRIWAVPTLQVSLRRQGGVFQPGTAIEGMVTSRVNGFDPASLCVIMKDRHGTVVAESRWPTAELSPGTESPTRHPGQDSFREEQASVPAAEQPKVADPVEPENLERLAKRETRPASNERQQGDHQAYPDREGKLLTAFFRLNPPPVGFYRLQLQLLDREERLLREDSLSVVVLPDSRKGLLDPSTGREQSLGSSFPGPILRQFGWSISPEALDLTEAAVQLAQAVGAVDIIRLSRGNQFYPRRLEQTEAALVQISRAGLLAGMVFQSPIPGETQAVRRWAGPLEPKLAQAAMALQYWQLGDEWEPECASPQEASTALNQLLVDGTKYPQPRTVLVPFAPTGAIPQITGDHVNLPGTSPSSPGPGRASLPPDAPDHVIIRDCWIAETPRVASVSGGAATAVPASPGGNFAGPTASSGSPARLASFRLPPKPQVAEDPKATVAETNAAAGILVRALCRATAADCRCTFVELVPSTLNWLVSPAGYPGELLLPWYVSTQILRNANPVGPFPIKPGVTAWLFAAAKQALIVLWCEEPTQVVLPLADIGLIIDAWGNTQVIKNQGEPLLLEVGPLPQFVFLPELWLLSWQQQSGFRTAELFPIPGITQQMTISLTNPTDQPLAGRLRLILPAGLRVSPEELPFQLAAGQKVELPVEVVLSAFTVAGWHPVGWEFVLDQPQYLQFRTERWIKIHWPGLELLQWQFRREASGTVLTVKLANRSSETLQVSAELFVPGAKRIALPPLTVSPGEVEITFPLGFDPPSNSGPAILQIRELRGPRRLRVELPLAGQGIRK
jgi:hypothetical protein